MVIQNFTRAMFGRTGGNLTMTIIAHIFSLPEVQCATDLYLNVDGASDNINYSVMYGLAHLLRSAHEAGWPLQRIHLLRFKVIRVRVRVTLFSLLTLIYPHCLPPTGWSHAQPTGRHLRDAVPTCLRPRMFRHHGPRPVVILRVLRRKYTTLLE